MHFNQGQSSAKNSGFTKADQDLIYGTLCRFTPWIMRIYAGDGVPPCVEEGRRVLDTPKLPTFRAAMGTYAYDKEVHALLKKELKPLLRGH